MKERILFWCLKKTLSHLQNWRLENASKLSGEDWRLNNNCCLYLHKHIKKLKSIK